MPEYTASFEWVCPHCGRRYDSLGGHRTGFVKRAAASHILACGKRTPAERWAADARDKARWAKHRTASIITLTPSHPGLRSVVPADLPDAKSAADQSNANAGRARIGSDTAGAPTPPAAAPPQTRAEPATKGFRRLKAERLRRSDQVRWSPAYLARHPAIARRADPTWAPISEGAWHGFKRTRACDWHEYEFRRATTHQGPGTDLR